MRTYLVNLAGTHDDAEEFEAEIEAEEVILQVRVLDGDDEPVVYDYKISPHGIDPIDI